MNALMLGSGVVSAIIGGAVLAKRGGGEQARVARRIAGTMALALGLALIVFAVGLSGNPANA